MSNYINDDKRIYLNEFASVQDQDVFAAAPVVPVPILQSTIILTSNQKSDLISFKVVDPPPQDNNVFLTDMDFSFNIQPIKGLGRLAFCDYAGHAAIQKVILTIGKFRHEFSSEIIWSRCPRDKRVFNAAGHNRTMRRVDVTTHEDQHIKGLQQIKIPFCLPFATNFPNSALPIRGGDTITVEVQMRKIDDIVNCSPGFAIDGGEFTDFVLKIHTCVKQSSFNSISYEPCIYFPQKVVGNTTLFDDSMAISIPKSNKYLIREKCDINGKNYLSSFGPWEEPEEAVNNYIRILLDNIIFVESAMPPNDEFIGIPKLVEVVDTWAYFPSSKHTTANPKQRAIQISIAGIPKDKRIFYHTNALTCQVGTQVLNLSEKFIRIVGSYDQRLQKIFYNSVDHAITTEEISLPLNKYIDCRRKCLDFKMKVQNWFTNGLNIFEYQRSIPYKIYSKIDATTPLNENCKDVIKEDDSRLPTDTLFQTILLGYSDSTRKIASKSVSELHDYVLSFAIEPLQLIKYEEHKCSKDVTTFNTVLHKTSGLIRLVDPQIEAYYYTNYIFKNSDNKTDMVKIV